MVPGLTNDQEYTFRVRPINLLGAAADSDEVAATPEGPPAAVTLMGTAGNGQVVLSWADPGDDDITKWQYRQKEGSGSYGAWTDIPGSDKDTTTYTVTSLTNDTEYSFRVRAVTGSLNGIASAEISLTPAAPTTHPCLLYTSPSPRDRQKSRMPSSA